MCKFSASCHLGCDDALACPDVTAAFGVVVKNETRSRAGKRAREVSGWWAKTDRRPTARTNAQGVRLCSVEGCNEPRIDGLHQCRKHRNEYHRAYREKMKAKVNAI